MPVGAALTILAVFAGVRFYASSDTGAGPAVASGGGSDPMGVRIDSYYRYDGRRLAISYTIGVPECYGTIDDPEVVETPESVIVTLSRVPPPSQKDGDVACIEIALLESVDVTLEEPLGDRRVLDGSFDHADVPPGPKRGDVPR